jgi:CO/xanthine dehydrogenase FAD-binding subunit
MIAAVSLADIEVVVPDSPEDAISQFGDGRDTLVVGGGTIVTPLLAHPLTHPGFRPTRALLLTHAGLSGVRRSGGKVTIGAATPIAELEGGDEPLATVAGHLGDLEVRGQATVGGNICAPSSPTFPRGDLQAPLIALGAVVRSTGAGGERVEPLEAGSLRNRLVLDLSYDDVPRATGYAAATRPHTHHYTIIAVAAARRDGELRVAASGVAPRAVRLRGVEESADASRALEGIEPRDDALASAWYRTTVLPRLVKRALVMLNGGEHD